MNDSAAGDRIRVGTPQELEANGMTLVHGAAYPLWVICAIAKDWFDEAGRLVARYPLAQPSSRQFYRWGGRFCAKVRISTRIKCWCFEEPEAAISPWSKWLTYIFSSRLALPFNSFSLSSAQIGRVSVHFVPGGLSTNG